MKNETEKEKKAISTWKKILWMIAIPTIGIGVPTLILYGTLTILDKINQNKSKKERIYQEAVITRALQEESVLPYDINLDGKNDYVFKDSTIFLSDNSFEGAKYKTSTIKNIYSEKVNSLEQNIQDSKNEIKQSKECLKKKIERSNKYNNQLERIISEKKDSINIYNTKKNQIDSIYNKLHQNKINYNQKK